MSAPEPQVRVYAGGWHCDCGWSGFIGHGQTQDDMERQAAKHKAECPLIRLQARWDARTEAERALITEWRTASERIGSGRMAIGYAAGRTDSADELERAIGGGDD